VEAILSDQERYANVSPVIESLDLASVIEEAALVIPDQNRPGIQLVVQPGLDEFRVRAHRVGLVQVLGNLILNAYESIRRGQATAGSITMAATDDELDGQPMVHLTITDSGCGFTPEVRHNIFQRGYSSKEGHQRGLGLHWCANALSNMGGRISAESEGNDLGASFHVLLPPGTDRKGASREGRLALSASRAAQQSVARSNDATGLTDEYATG